MALSFAFDTEKFIYLVEKHRLLWDGKNPHHLDQRRRDAAWNEIAEAMFDDFEYISLKEKYEKVKLLRIKWRNVKNSYSKERQLAKKETGDATKRKPYKYISQLSFLGGISEQEIITPSNLCDTSANENSVDESNLCNPIMDEELHQMNSVTEKHPKNSKQKKSQQKNFTSEEEAHQNSSVSEEHTDSNSLPEKKAAESSSVVENRDRGRMEESSEERKEEDSSSDDNVFEFQNEISETAKLKKRSNPFEEELLTLLKNTEKQERDCDYLFLMSLYNDMKRVPMENKLRLKKRILDVMEQEFYYVSHTQSARPDVSSSSHQVRTRPMGSEMHGGYGPFFVLNA